MSRKILIFCIISIVAILIVVITNNIYAMKYNNTSSLQILRNWILWLEIFSLIALSLTIVFGGAAIVLRKKSDKIEQKEKIKTELKIARSISKADSATAIAEKSRLKQKEAEIKEKELRLELERLRLSVRDRVIPSDKIPLVKEKLSARAGEKISFICLGSDIEAVNFKNQLVSLFKTHFLERHNHLD
jgi:hypothetical protein